MLLYYAGKGHIKYQNFILLILSILFYAWGEPLFVFLMLGSVAVNYYLGILISRSDPPVKKRILTVSVIWNLSILFVFKYLTFTSSVISRFFPVRQYSIALPIGISFFTFQIMSYIWDVYYGKAKVQDDPVSLALYITMFPQLIAGPIVRYNTINREIENRTETFDDFSRGASRFVIGLSKKVLIADFLAGIADSIFKTAEYAHIPAANAWLGAAAYSLQIYYDFSGYSDMAIGLGLCLGFHFLENFDRPYLSSSITEFWKRWHISLTSWFRDYVYIPLGGNKVSPGKHFRNLFIVWLLSGIWHGAGWNFIVWGLVYFALQMLEKQTGLADRIPRFAGRIYTLLAVGLLWVVFRARNLGFALSYLGDLFLPRAGLTDESTIQYFQSSFVVVAAAVFFCTPAAAGIYGRLTGSTGQRAGTAVRTACAVSGVVLYILCIMIVVDGAYSPFIYFNF